MDLSLAFTLGYTRVHGACAELYHELLCDWRTWKETEPIKKPEVIGPLIERIRKLLYWR